MHPDFSERLRKYGFRATPGRIRLMRFLWLAKRPLTVDEIATHINKDVVTVYRALDDLCRAGLVLRGIGSGELRAAHFSYPRSGHHHHLVCADCGFSKACATCK